MNFQRFFRITLLTACCAGFALPLNTIAEEEKYFSTWEFQFSDKNKLVWYYQTEKDFKVNQPNKARVGNKEFILRPDVRPPTMNSIYLLEYAQVFKGEEVLDMGTGCGLHAIFVADESKARRIVATDIYQPSVDIAKLNAQRLGVEQKIDFRVGDLFEPIRDDEKFDVIFININFPFSVGNDDRYRLHERFFSEVHKHMKQEARIYFQTSFVENMPYILDLLGRNHFRIKEMHMKYVGGYQHEPMLIVVQSDKVK